VELRILDDVDWNSTTVIRNGQTCDPGAPGSRLFNLSTFSLKRRELLRKIRIHGQERRLDGLRYDCLPDLNFFAVKLPQGHAPRLAISASGG
jgi:hypothetical protein